MPQIYTESSLNYEIGKAIEARPGNDLTIVACGLMVGMALDAAAMLAGEGVQARVLDLHTLRPMDKQSLVKAARETGAIVTAEEHLLQGGMGSNVARVIAESCPVPMRFVGLADTYAESADPDDLLAKYHLTAQDIAVAARDVFSSKLGS
jgi:transketolase